MTFRSSLAAVVTFLIALASSQACAAEPAMQPAAAANFGKFYIGASGGILIPESTRVTITGSITGAGDINYKNAAAVTGFVGYNLTDNLAAEGELGYSSVDYDNVSGTLTAGTLGSVSGTININGHAEAVVGLLNAIVHPLGHARLAPYIGAGLGFAATDSQVNSLSTGRRTATVNASHSDTDLAMNALAGVDLALTDNISVGGRYRYLWINSATSTTASGVTGAIDDFSAHMLTAQATLHF